MKNLERLVLLAAAALLFMVPAAHADTVSINGTYAFSSNGYGIPPYGGTLDGAAAEFYCVDFSHDIQGGDTWNAIVTPLTNSANYSSTYLQNENTYLEFAWLLTQMQDTTSQAAIAADQWAIWSVTGGSDPFTGQYSSQTLLLDAQNAVNAGFTGQGWEILTPAPGNYGQEFMIDPPTNTPETSGLLLLAIGLCGLFLLNRYEGFSFSTAAERA